MMKPVEANRPESHLLDPFWKSTTSYGESLLFVQEEGGRPTAKLLFKPLQLLSLRSAMGQTTYVEGQDYVLDQLSNTLTLPEGSRIPFKTIAELHPPKGSPNSMKNEEDPKRDILWFPNRVFHDIQVEATYTHSGKEWAENKGYLPAYAGSALSLSLAKLQQKTPLNIVVLGDSISVGMSASGVVGVPPQMPAYPELVRRTLQEHYGTPTTLTNLSVGGKTTTWGLEQNAAVINAKPDLVILAFGMNDAPKIPPQRYIANIKRQVNQIKAALPNTEFILVASSLPNPEWQTAKTAGLHRYEAGLKSLSGPGIAVADLTAVWTEVLKRKRYVSLTGNGVNHPNDFGHRLYAQVMLGLLIENTQP